MSQHSLMTIRERKMQAAAICREIQGPDEAEMDLGRKVNVPKEIMFEELSLASNRGSRLFKMRQQRSEKYTFESIRNEVNTQINNGMIFQTPNAEVTDVKADGDGLGTDQPTDTPPNMPDPLTVPNPESIAPGYGGPLKDVPAEKFNSTAMPRSYCSPWVQAIIGDPSLADTMVTHMPAPEPKTEAPEYKSFNRVATPFGGFGKAPKVTPVKVPEEDLGLGSSSPVPPAVPADPVAKRPTFNRTALGWVTENAPLVLPTVALDTVPSIPSTFIPESDDL
ncbi:myozenin-2a [Chanos chanos]|uniref:Myozenin-2a n=1 Tax=Chanos chanos TaxID=29144 RepID=A0A6J2VXF7_CHACN|nr:myozenin-2-like [Chanos chanos]